jgi:hypothetical protein
LEERRRTEDNLPMEEEIHPVEAVEDLQDLQEPARHHLVSQIYGNNQRSFSLSADWIHDFWRSLACVMALL